MVIFRPAQEVDLAQMHEVVYLNDTLGIANPPPLDDTPSVLLHIFRTGTSYVAEQESHILAFAAAITRGEITYLTDLFVRPEQQSSQLGRILLSHVLPQDNLIHCTMSSTDSRALALYIRAGMRPQWPHFVLRLEKPVREDSPITEIEIVEAVPDDPELVRWDAEASGRSRPLDSQYWVTSQRAVPLWFRRNGQTIGYGYVRLGAGSFWYPNGCTIGPIGVKESEDATDCVLAAVHWAGKHAEVLFISVPGAHPSLSPLLSKGFRIVYVETFLSTADPPFFDPRRYIASGSDLL
jgi:GNAT superfamily N-acetyltransferase